ncbi:MAG: AI-2E family transporter [Clostridia bacterium]|nr:AI-2E family transporter [Clostridia bacterium]
MKKIDLKLIFSISAAIIIVYLLTQYWPNISDAVEGVISAASPIIFGFLVAYPINILMSFYERRFFPNSKKKIVIKLRKFICLLAAIISIIGIVAAIIVIVAPQFIECIQMLFSKIPPTFDFVMQKFNENEFLSKNVVSAISQFNWQEKLGEMSDKIAQGIGDTVGFAFSAITSIFTTVANIIITLIISVYVLLERDRLLRQVRKIGSTYLPDKVYKKSYQVLSTLNESFHRFIVGQCLEAVILGTLCTIGMLIFQIPYAPMIGALMGFTALIPIFGGLIGAGVGAFLILMDSPIKALFFIIFVIVLQQIEGNLIYPKVVGTSTGLPGLWVLAAVTIGGAVSGILGMLVAVPIAATIYKLVRDDIDNTNKKTPWDFIAVPEHFKDKVKKEQ